ncbi:MAG TPA: amidohydrolase family protein, partial [Acidobacteriota bacterium]|nr:amidohydrolase family protein [Acidobacteriota bacterium]
LKKLGIDRNFRVSDGGAGQIERDPATGEPTGLLRGLHRLVEMDLPGREPTEEDYYQWLLEMFRDFNSVGLTAVSDRGAYPDYIERFERMYDRGELPVRMALMYRLLSREPADLEQTLERIREVANHPLHREDPWLKILGIKVSLDGGMLTGSAYMREPWGVSDIYGISDPEYRGVLSIPPDQLLALARTTFESGLQFTAHCVGDGAVHTILETYKEINKTLPLRDYRPSVTHSNFMSAEAIEMAAELGAVLDIQPAWLYLDTRTLVQQFGYERMRYFQPLHSLFQKGVMAGGGTDHMQKIGSLRSVNPYNPFLGMWTTITRQARDYDGVLYPEERLTRAQAIRFYTINNAYLLHWEDEIGSLEPEKRADFIVLDRDILTCPEDEIKDIQVLQTYIDGSLMYARP